MRHARCIVVVRREEEQIAEEREQESARWSQWMHRANAGDAQAYRDLLQEIGVVVERYLRRRFGASDFVEECVQECLLSIHRARASYDPSRSFRAWMFTIVRHKAIDTLRRRGTRARWETSEGDAGEAAAPANESAATLQVREALVLTKLEGRSLNEAAKHVGVSVTAMKSRVHRAIQQSRRLLEMEGD